MTSPTRGLEKDRSVEMSLEDLKQLNHLCEMISTATFNITLPKIFAEMFAQVFFGHATSANALLKRMPGRFNRLGVGPSIRVNKVARVVNRKVLESLRVKSTIGFPAVRH
ncbi:unnamed protein product [Sphagnum jensenii]|uniref:Uncharacterized protein n=1 Tax=Sphagnum jensenii TaxID=128206 RepID=A0ABP0V6E2_9BRYO